jgi:hypothetical protein
MCPWCMWVGFVVWLGPLLTRLFPQRHWCRSEPSVAPRSPISHRATENHNNAPIASKLKKSPKESEGEQLEQLRTMNARQQK